MPRFKQGDAVFILPKFAHLYPNDSARVVTVKADPLRPMFNEYTVEFADGSTTGLFEFQLIEDLVNYRTLIAGIVFDSRQQMATTKARGRTSGAQIIFQAPGFDIDIRIRTGKAGVSVMGQVLERDTASLLGNVQVCLLQEATAVNTTRSDGVGVFRFSNVPHGPLSILVVIPQHLSRILGAFSI